MHLEAERCATSVTNVILVRKLRGKSRVITAKTGSYSVAAIATPRPIQTTNSVTRLCACDHSANIAAASTVPQTMTRRPWP